MLNLIGLRRLERIALCAEMTLRIVGDIFLDILYVSVTRACKFLIWVEAELSFSSSLLKDEGLSSYVTFKSLLWDIHRNLFYGTSVA